MIAIVDYGMGNLMSVQKAFTHLGFEARIVSEESEIK
jgi:glutamine amidotransferase